ncbi:MAG: Ca2+-dependent phosphoinositide-specific phospholipase C [bacterium]
MDGMGGWPAEGDSGDWPVPDSGPPTLLIHHMQVRGSENSYHLAPDERAPVELQYSHPPFATQLGAQGLRLFDFDTAYNSAAAAVEVYAHDLGDEGTRCHFIGFCLLEMAAWSDANPHHAPVFVLIESNVAQDLQNGLQYLQRDIRSTLGRERLYIPLDLQGRHASVRDAVLADGLAADRHAARCFIFVLHDRDRARAEAPPARMTLVADPERLLFMLADTPEDEWAAFFSFDVIDDEATVSSLIAQGFLVRTIVDDPIQPGAGDRARGASAEQPIPEVEPAPGSALGGWPVACNPVTAPAGCEPWMIEPEDGP